MSPFQAVKIVQIGVLAMKKRHKANVFLALRTNTARVRQALPNDAAPKTNVYVAQRKTALLQHRFALERKVVKSARATATAKRKIVPFATPMTMFA